LNRKSKDLHITYAGALISVIKQQSRWTWTLRSLRRIGTHVLATSVLHLTRSCVNNDKKRINEKKTLWIIYDAMFSIRFHSVTVLLVIDWWLAGIPSVCFSPAIFWTSRDFRLVKK